MDVLATEPLSFPLKRRLLVRQTTSEVVLDFKINRKNTYSQANGSVSIGSFWESLAFILVLIVLIVKF